YGVHQKGNHPSFGKSYKAAPDFSKKFHKLLGYWTKDKITCFVDGKKVYESSKGVPHEKMYVILNLAVGGDWPGMPDKNTKFPGEMLVDYVRVYEKTR
ncbi:MAG: family 16 glycosylhydrolase, partial [Microbacteriaceae bacterium]|nr:family 16 glycosylhydrolase [Microbacteriaceae bacterium]